VDGEVAVDPLAIALAYDAQGQVLKHEQDLTMIPYYAWANRGRGQMTVWMPNIEGAWLFWNDGEQAWNQRFAGTEGPLELN
jgi:hypothetical protein